MDLQLSNSTSELYFISNDLFENQTLLIFSLILSTLITFLGPPLLLAIIWFERFGSDKKRTILNMFVNMNCWNCIALVLLGQVPEIVIYSAGPLPPMLCNIHSVIRESIICSILMYIDAIIVFRFVYIFKLKNPAAFRDDFWCLFVSLWIYIFDLIAVGTLNIWANFQSVPTFICTGQIAVLPSKSFDIVLSFFAVNSALLHFTINLIIYFYKRKFKILIETNKKQILAKLFDLKNIEVNSLATVGTDFLGICMFFTAVASYHKLSAVNPKNFKVYPNYLFLLYLDLIAPSLSIIFVIVLFFRKKALRSSLQENLKSIFAHTCFK